MLPSPPAPWRATTIGSCSLVDVRRGRSRTSPTTRCRCGDRVLAQTSTHRGATRARRSGTSRTCLARWRNRRSCGRIARASAELRAACRRRVLPSRVRYRHPRTARTPRGQSPHRCSPRHHQASQRSGRRESRHRSQRGPNGWRAYRARPTDPSSHPPHPGRAERPQDPSSRR